MKISVNDQELFTLSDMQCKVICNDIPKDIFEEDMKRRLNYILQHKYERCLERLKAEWMPKLASRIDAIPTNDEKFVELVLAQPDYMCRKTRDDAAKGE